MFLIDAIKHKVENKFKTCFIVFRNCLGKVSRKRTNKTSFVSFRVMFSSGNKNFNQNKRENNDYELNFT